METLVIISVALIVLLLGGIIILYLDERQNAVNVTQPNYQHSNDQVSLKKHIFVYTQKNKYKKLQNNR